MGIFSIKKSYLLASSAALGVCVLMIVFSDIAVLAAKKGIMLWFTSVLPAMLPFFICVNFMTGIGLIRLLPEKVFPFVMSALSGYPIGAKVAGDMCRSGMIEKNEAKRLMSYCSTSGPVFMVGAVGVGMLGSQEAGVVIAVAHYLGALLNGVMYSIILGGSGMTCSSERKIEEYDFMEKLSDSIFASFKSMSVILAYIIFFTFIMDIIDVTGLFNFVDSVSGRILIKGFMEMTVGCSILSSEVISLQQAAIFASVIISWGGLSILGQSMSMLAGTGISAGYIAVTKLTHSIFAGIIALFIGKLML